MALIENGGAPGGGRPRDAAETAANFREAATILRAISKLHVAYDAEIGLAELMRRRGQIDTALQQITPILPCLPIQAAPGWDEPIRLNIRRAHLVHRTFQVRCTAGRVPISGEL